MQGLGVFTLVRTEIGQIIVADVNRERVGELIRPEADSLAALIRKAIPQHA
jgi:isocitrate lyase